MFCTCCGHELNGHFCAECDAPAGIQTEPGKNKLAIAAFAIGASSLVCMGVSIALLFTVISGGIGVGLLGFFLALVGIVISIIARKKAVNHKGLNAGLISSILTLAFMEIAIIAVIGIFAFGT